jgi:hypothetical protein
MALTASDVASLATSMKCWEYAEYFFAFLVAVACFGEYVADFTKWWKREGVWPRLGPIEGRKDKLAKLSTLLLIASLVFETVCLFRTNQISGEMLGSLSDLSEEAFRTATRAKDDAAAAITRSGEAVSKAGLAEGASGRAIRQSGDAQETASSAMVLARGVRQEADSFKRDIVEAVRKERALNSELSDTEKLLEKTKGELVNLAICSAPRIIPLWWDSEMGSSVDPLRRFAGQIALVEFLPDAESRRAAVNIARALAGAGWSVPKLTGIDGIDDGVEIQPYAGPTSPINKPDVERQNERKASDAAEGLLDFLVVGFNWQAKVGLPLDAKRILIRDPNVIPPGSIRIRVGLYPAVEYVVPSGSKEMAAELDRREQMIQKMEDERTQRVIKANGPEAKIAIERFRTENERAMRSRKNPCQPLSPSLLQLR